MKDPDTWGTEGPDEFARLLLAAGRTEHPKPHSLKESLHALNTAIQTTATVKHPSLDAVQDTERDELKPGTMIDHFKLVRIIGEGGMGSVYLARDTHLGRKVALKVVRPDYLGIDGGTHRLAAEAQMIAKLNHPHIVTVHAVGKHKGTLYVALEYLEGENLRQRMSERQLSLSELLRYAVAIAEALVEAHANGVWHRDLKPANVVIPGDGRLRVVDFGMASWRPQEERSPASQELGGLKSLIGSDIGSLPAVTGIGTPAFMAPEQWREKVATGASDIWAFGMMLYEMASGELPFVFESIVLLAAAVTDDIPAPPLEGDAPAALKQLVADCLNKNPGDRPSAQEVMVALRALQQTGRPSLGGVDGPFRGLLPFTNEHANLFFGRDAEIEAFVERLRLDPVLLVVGASGVGKSSFVQAGVVPRLLEQGSWRVLQFRPGAQPFRALARRLLEDSHLAKAYRSSRPSRPSVAEMIAQGGDDQELDYLSASLRTKPAALSIQLRHWAETQNCRILMVVDQLEELFTHNDDPDTKRLFMEALVSAADDFQDPVRVVITVRDDFLGRLALSEPIRRGLQEVMVLQKPGPDALHEVLRKPLQLIDYDFDDTQLVDEMVDAVRDEPTGLALLQFTAQRLWDHRDKEQSRLTRAAYRAIGGVEGALAQHADGVLETCSQEEVSLARQLLLRLVTPERTRQMVSRTQACEGLGPKANNVLDRLIQARLLSSRKVKEQEANLELTHESLIRNWGTLSRWLEESHEDIAWLADIEQAARLWAKRGQRAEELWKGDALVEGRRWRARATVPIPELVDQFLHHAQAKAKREMMRKRITIGALFVVLSAVALVLAAQKQQLATQKFESDRLRLRAETQGAAVLLEAARAAYAQGDLLGSRAQLRTSLEANDYPAGRALWWQLRDDPLVWHQGLSDLVYAVDFNPKPDENVIAAACGDRSIYLLDTNTRALRVLRGHTDQVSAVEFSPDGSKLASSDYSGGVHIWNTRSGEIVHSLPGHTGVVRTVSYSADNNLLATGGDDKTALLWDARTGRKLRSLSGHTAAVWSLSFNSDGTMLATGSLDETIRLWDVATGKLKSTLSSNATAMSVVDFSPNGRELASGSADKTVRIWDVVTGKVKRILSGHTALVRTLDYSPDGQKLVTGSNDKTVRIWDAHTGRELRTLSGHSAAVYGVSFNATGSLVTSSSSDETVRLWNLRAGELKHTLSGHESSVYGVSFSPDSRWIASGSRDKTVRIWDTQTGEPKRVLSGHMGTVMGVSFSSNGDLLASGSWDKTIRLWNAGTGEVSHILSGHMNGISGVAFSPDSSLLASGSNDKTVRIWDATTGEPKHTLLGHTAGVSAVRFSPDGSLLGSGSWDKTVRLWNPLTGQLMRTLSGHGEVALGIGFTADSRTVASGSADKTVRLWDTRSGKEKLSLEQLARAHWIDIHPSAQLVGVPSSDGVARIWDVAKKRVTTELRGHSSEVNSLRFSPNGKYAATTSEDNTVRLWDLATGRSVWHAPLLLASPPRLLSHRGWTSLDETTVGAAGEGAPDPKSATVRKQQLLAGTHQWQRAIEQRARFAKASPDGERLCLQSFDEKLELWDMPNDTQIKHQAITHLAELRAVAGGCFLRTRGAGHGRALILAADGKTKTLATEGEVTALGSNNRELFVAAGKHVFVFDHNGAPHQRYAASVGITAVARVSRDWLAVGYINGNLELVSTSAPTDDQAEPSPRLNRAFERTPSSPARGILPGPKNTLIASYDNGLVGIWSRRDGKPLATKRIHGPIQHLLFENHKLYAASSLGQYLRWDLGVFFAPRCELLHDVWQQVPVIWESGQAVARPAPTDHPCQAK